MEFCGGGSVADVLHYCKMSFNEKQAVAVSFCILKGLQHLHEKNITHRDIKGANILLTQKGMAKISPTPTSSFLSLSNLRSSPADFGVSKIQKKEQKMSTVVGSPYWMAPEVIRMGSYTNTVPLTTSFVPF